jgi:uncharacterized protein
MYWSAFFFGLLGSFHCVGMCGPIALSVPGKTLAAKLIYNVGRTITYIVMGGIVGFVGEGFSFFGWQQILSVGAGFTMLVIIIFTRYKHFDLPTSGVFDKLWLFLKKKLAPLFTSKSSWAPFFVGLVNGLLPCGLVYAALFTAVSMGGIVESASYMALFGLGTIPLLLGITIFGDLLSPVLRSNFKKIIPYFLAIVAILLILRGLNLGIPMISPKMDKSGDMNHMHSMGKLDIMNKEPDQEPYKQPKASDARLWVGVVFRLTEDPI